ncbi:MAG TPA: Imm50 family immunity protein [Longimicrobium sp.]|nr:Imm50 family immunity protein [Longimicrobium sp.]
MWFDACENPQAFAQMYASAGGLDEVELFEAVLTREGRLLRLRMELPRFPERPPARWSPDANRVQVTVDFWSVEELRIEGWRYRIPGRLSLVRAGDGLRLAFDSPGVRITAWCALARIDRFSAYTGGTGVKEDADARLDRAQPPEQEEVP